MAIVDHESGTSEEVRTCITGAHFFNGKKVRTVEGHAKTDDKGEVHLSRFSRRFWNITVSSAVTARRVL